jgi:mRNA interferase YafQ
MTSKKPAQQKRANLPRSSDKTRHFVKDWERLSHSGRYNMRHLKEVMLLLIGNDSPLPPEYLDHELVGEWIGFRECHIGGDFLLIYELRQDGSVIFTRAGTHADLFE